MVLRWAGRRACPFPCGWGLSRCEESSNFGCCTIGSGLVTKELHRQRVAGLVSRGGETLESIFESRGYSLDPPRISGLSGYLELHIEQGKVLEDSGTAIELCRPSRARAASSSILRGLAEHSGATPWLCAATPCAPQRADSGD